MRTVHQQLLLVHKNNVPASGTGYRPRLLAGAVVNSHEPLGMPECAGLWGCDPSLPEPSLLTRGAAEATHVGTGGEPFCYVQALTTWLCQIFRGGEPRAPRPQGVSFPAYVHLGLHRQRPGGGAHCCTAGVFPELLGVQARTAAHRPRSLSQPRNTRHPVNKVDHLHPVEGRNEMLALQLCTYATMHTAGGSKQH